MLASPWFWGFCGAFIYAAPRFSTCLFSGAVRTQCVVDALCSIAVGPLAAGAFTEAVLAWFHVTDPHHGPAVAALIGLLANPVTPGAIDDLSSGLRKRLRKLLGGEGG